MNSERSSLEAERVVEVADTLNRFDSDDTRWLTRTIGKIEQGKSLHYYSRGNFNLVRLIVHLLKQTGPADVMMSSYSFSSKSIGQLQQLISRGQITGFRILLDNRVRVMSPKPFQMISASFDYRCIAVHAKLALIWNADWTITVVTSQNATDNPKLERGIIFTSKDMFDFDFKILSDEFERGTT